MLKMLKILFLFMKHIFNKDFLQTHLDDFLEAGKIYLNKTESLNFIRSLVVYLCRTTKISSDEIVKSISKISTQGGNVAMTTARKLHQDGWKEGQYEEKIKTAKKMLNKNCEIAFVKEITGLSIEEIQKLLNEL